MGKKSFKDLFVQKEETNVEDMIEYSNPMQSYFSDEDMVKQVEVTIPDGYIDADNFINAVYEQANIQDLSRSIFKIEEIIAKLPMTMPTADKFNSVIGMLDVMGLNIDEVMSDAQNRVDYISEYSNKITNNIVTDTTNIEAEIESLKIKITELQGKKDELAAYNSQINDISKKECDRIKELYTFISNTENQ